jgi:hypothetical protein
MVADSLQSGSAEHDACAFGEQKEIALDFQFLAKSQTKGAVVDPVVIGRTGL